MTPSSDQNPISDGHRSLIGFLWKHEERSWVGSVRLDSGVTVSAAVKAVSNLSKEVSLASLSSLSRIASTEDEIRRAIAAHVVDEINDHWRRTPDRIKSKQIARRLEPRKVLLAVDGSATIVYADDRLFWGHPLYALLSPEGTLKNTGTLDIQGSNSEFDTKK